MFRQMRRIKQQLSKEESIELLKKQQRGFLTVIGDYDYPYVFPMNYVYADNKIYFHSAMEGHKVDSIKKHKKVSFSIIDDGVKAENDWYNIFKSVIVFGQMKFLEDEIN